MEISFSITLERKNDRLPILMKKIGSQISGESAKKLPLACTVMIGEGVIKIRPLLEQKYAALSQSERHGVPYSSFEIIEMARLSCLSCFKSLTSSEIVEKICSILRQSDPSSPDDGQMLAAKTERAYKKLREDVKAASDLVFNEKEEESKGLPILISGILCCFLLLNKPITFGENNISLNELVEVLEAIGYQRAALLEGVLGTIDAIDAMRRGE